MKIQLLAAVVATTLPALAAGALSQADVQAVIAKRSNAPLSNFTFGAIQIAGARAASNGEIGHLGLPPGVTVTPVRATYTEKTGGCLGRDHVQNFLFYYDDFGGWSMQAQSVPGNMTSDLKKVC